MTNEMQFNMDAAMAARDAAMDQVEEAATPLFNKIAYDVLEALARAQPYVTADDVFMRARNANLIVADGFTISARVQGHGRPMRIWRSLVVGDAG